VRLEALVRAIENARVDGRRIASWSVFASESCRVSLGTKDRETGNPHAPLSLSEGLTARYRVIWDDGLVSRGALERRRIEREPDTAWPAARAAAFDDPDGRDVAAPATFPEVAVHDAGAAKAARGDVSTLALRLAAIRERVARFGLRTWSGSFGASEGTGRVMTSAGLDVSGAGTSSGWHVSFDGEIGAGYSGRAPEDDAGFVSRLDRLVETALALRGPASARAGGEGWVLLHPDVVDEYVLGVLLHNLDGVSVAHGTGAFRREQFGSGAAVLREDLTLRHDPLVPMAAGAYRFSQEGLPAAPVTFIDQGRLVAPVLDLKYARRLGMAPTAAPAAMDTLFFEGPEPLSYDEALGRAAGGALVLNVLGVHTQDFTSGDFSLSAPQTLAIGPSGIEGRLRATISGNVFRILRSDDLALVRFAGEHTPGLLVRCRIDFV
jgi:PmbA protein